jgi:hypothetical protein
MLNTFCDKVMQAVFYEKRKYMNGFFNKKSPVDAGDFLFLL